MNLSSNRAYPLPEVYLRNAISSIKPTNHIALRAVDRADSKGISYAKANVPTSPFPELSGNRVPEQSPIRWLRGVNKCNQLVGDVLTLEGFAMPTYTMKDGSKHYRMAEDFPKQPTFFDRLKSLDSLQEGDVLVIDYPGRGESTAHVEIVTGFDLRSGVLMLTGARKDGARERDASNMIPLLKRANVNGEWAGNNGNKIYLLRAIAKK